jgi:hypothetical protein
MRTLTQVWVFFVSLTFLFLLMGFEFGGRLGLFVAFLISLFFIYATLHRSLLLFKKKLNTFEYSGNDPTGFLNEIQSQKLKFGFKKVYLYKTLHNSPPLIWKNRADEGHVVVNARLLDNLSPEEVRLTALLFLSHLENRSFMVTPILSVINQGLFGLGFVSGLLSAGLTFIFKSNKDVLKSDKKFRLMSDASDYEIGYFMNRLHQFEFHQNKKNSGIEYFSVLSLQKNLFNQYGIPTLNKRLKQIMGFSV